MSSDPYLYPGTSVLRDHRGLRDKEKLSSFEQQEAALAIRDLCKAPVSGDFDYAHLREIHRRIMLIGIRQRPLFLPPNNAPPCGTEGQLGRSRPDQPAGTNHPIPFYADHHWLPFRRCTMRRSFCNQREGANSDADSPLQRSSLQAFQHPNVELADGEKIASDCWELQGNRLNKPLTRLYFLNRGVRAHLFFRRFRMSCTPNDSTAPAFLTHFQAVEDPRQEGKVLYPL